MRLALRGMVGRGLARTFGQVAMSVLATLIATSIYSGLRRAERDATAVTSPPLTSGGKYGIRIEGAEMPPLPEPVRPVLGVVNWTITPPRITAAVPEPGSVILAQPALDILSPGKAHPVRRPARQIGTPVATPPVRPGPTIAAAPSATFFAVSLPSADADPGIWARAAAAVGQTARSVADLGGSAWMVGGQAVSHLMPWQH